MTDPTRRQWLAAAAAGLLAPAAPAPGRAGPAGKGCTLGFGTYGMKDLPLDKAVATIAEVGFDGVEIATMPGYGGEPGKLPADRRRDLRQLLGEKKLRLTALMENLPPVADAARHKADLDRLRRVLELAHDLAPDALPVVQTVLGGGKWEEKRALFRDRVGDWLVAGRDAKVVLAVKPHRGGAMSRPEEAVWLIDQLGKSPFLRMVYDYSHYAFRDMTPEETVRTALPYTAHVAAKDAVRQGDRVTFALPGEGGFDHSPLLRLLHAGGYRGDVCCEVSSVVSGAAGYDPVAAARVCYRNMARAFERARVPRG